MPADVWNDAPDTDPNCPRRPVGRRTLLLAATAAAAAASTGCGAATGTAKWVDPAVEEARPSPAGSPLSGPADEVTHGPRDKPAVALTFHGDGDEALARALLDQVERAGARITVLAVGSWLTAHPGMAQRILDGGHELGNHTQNHLAIAELGPVDVFTEINECANALKQLTGSIGRWFRPSQTQTATDTIRAQAARVGYPTCLSYDLDSLDYTDPDPATVVRTVTDSVGNGSIVSLHLGHTATLTAIPDLLERLRQRGLRPVTMTELMS